MLYAWRGAWAQIYNENLYLREKVEIYKAFELACDTVGIHPLKTGEYGEIAEDRDSQITFSMLGQSAPLAIKKPFDPDQAKRLKLAYWLNGYFYGKNLNYETTVGGASSMDITRKGSNKAAGVSKFLAFMATPKSEAVFVADALYPGGNDHSVIGTGVECIPTKNPEETKEIIRKLLGASNAAV